jgi:hypothetical protein
MCAAQMYSTAMDSSGRFGCHTHLRTNLKMSFPYLPTEAWRITRWHLPFQRFFAKTTPRDFLTTHSRFRSPRPSIRWVCHDLLACVKNRHMPP